MQRLVTSSNPSKLSPIRRADLARTLACQMKPNTTYTQGQRLGQVTATGVYAPRGDGTQTDGSQRTVAIVCRNFTTDAQGTVFYGIDVPQTGWCSDGEPTAMNYFSGDYLRSQLPGISDAEIAELGAKTLGVGAAQEIHIP